MAATPYKIPRPFHKLSKELIETIVKDIEEGSHQKYAAEANGITERIFYIWVQQGIMDIECSLDTLPSFLVQSLSKVKQKEVQNCRRAILSDEKGHKGAEWTLEHAYWRQFGASAPVLEMAKDIEDLKNGVYKDAENHGEKPKEDGNSSS